MKPVLIFIWVCIFIFSGCEEKDKSTEPIIPTGVFNVYSDSGLSEGADVWTWSGEDWGGPAGIFDANYPDTTAPEGIESFYTKSGASWSGGSNYAGWGIFHVQPSDHTVDLSSHAYLRFWVKSPSDLKVQIQFNDRNGSKGTTYISDNGWDGTNTWQDITIPASTLGSGNLNNVFGVFMATVEASNTTFFIDQVRWEID